MTTQSFWQGFWRLADPKISLASFAGMFMAACFAAADTGLHWGWLALTVLGVFCVEVAKNASGEWVDFDSGTDLAIAEQDRSPFSGGKRVMVDGLMTRAQTRAVALVFFLAAIAIGLAITFLREPRVLAIGLLGMALAWSYHGAPLRLSYRGMGEVAVAIAYGPLVVWGTYLVQTGALSAPLLHAAMALGLLIAAFLWINEFPDYQADLGAGKRTLVVRLGRETAAVAYVTLLGAGYLWLLFCALHFQLYGMLWGLLGALPAAFSAWRLVQRYPETAAIVPAQAACLLSFLLMAAGCGLGYWLSGA